MKFVSGRDLLIIALSSIADGLLIKASFRSQPYSINLLLK